MPVTLRAKTVEVGSRRIVFFLESDVDDVRPSLDRLGDRIAHPRGKNDDEGRVIAHLGCTLRSDFAHGHPVVAEHLGERAGAITVLIANANGHVVVPHLAEEGRTDQGNHRDRNEQEHRTRRRETLARRGSDDCDLPGLHDSSFAWLHRSRRTGVKERSASTSSRETAARP